MDLLPYWFLIGIVLMSGGIAVLADGLGRRLGKKRLHVRGLRPKQVAQIGTFLAGICVSFGTILLVAVLSSSVRQWIREGNVAIARVKAVQGELDRSTHELDMERTEDARLTRNNSRLQQATNRAQFQLRETQKEAGDLALKMADIRSRLAALRTSYDSANRRIVGLNDEMARRKHDLTLAQSRLSETERHLTAVNQQLEAASESEKQVMAARAVAIKEKRQTDLDNQQVREENGRLTAEKDRLTVQRDELLKESADASAQYMMVSKDLEAAKKDLLLAKSQLAETQTALAHFEGEDAFYKAISNNARIEPPIYLRGEEVARLPVQSGLSVARAAGEITSLLRRARIEAKARGASGHGEQPEALLVSHGSVTPDELEQEAALKIAGAAQPMVLIATSSLNAFKGESVSLEIEAMPNPLVYHRNTLVAKADVDGRLETDVIFRQLSDLGQKVEERAKADKMIPHYGASEMYGAVSPDQVLRLVNEVKANNRAVEVRAFADADTRAADPLRLHFSVR